ncbi:hypothetical protein BX600DRAFT_941 [Xylariales sp. PMI_506]|nr:hypothetical protein BX600DRAFT_941 [Xylariales sp. PMI_506]
MTQLKLEVLDTDIRSFIDNYQAGQRTVTELIAKEAFRSIQHISAEISRVGFKLDITTVEIQNASEDVKSHINDAVVTTIENVSNRLLDFNFGEKRKASCERLLTSLKFPGMNERRQQVTESYPETFQWAFGDADSREGDEYIKNYKNKSDGQDKLESPSLRKYQISSDYGIHNTPWDSLGDWLRSDYSLYWISGKPGSGKTTLVKYFVTNTRTKLALDSWNNRTFILSRFFWRPGSPMQQNIRGVLCSLLYQLLSVKYALIDDIISNMNDIALKENYTDWSVQELKLTFHLALQTFGRPLCIFLDGLDEVDPSDGILDLFEVVDMLRQSR